MTWSLFSRKKPAHAVKSPKSPHKVPGPKTVRVLSLIYKSPKRGTIGEVVIHERKGHVNIKGPTTTPFRLKSPELLSGPTYKSDKSPKKGTIGEVVIHDRKGPVNIKGPTSPDRKGPTTTPFQLKSPKLLKGPTTSVDAENAYEYRKLLEATEQHELEAIKQHELKRLNDIESFKKLQQARSKHETENEQIKQLYGEDPFSAEDIHKYRSYTLSARNRSRNIPGGKRKRKNKTHRRR